MDRECRVTVFHPFNPNRAVRGYHEKTVCDGDAHDATRFPASRMAVARDCARSGDPQADVTQRGGRRGSRKNTRFDTKQKRRVTYLEYHAAQLCREQ